jgi:multidrug efflux system outer membrane protein
MKNVSQFTLMAVASGLFAGCAVGPKYGRPAATAGTNSVPMTFSGATNLNSRIEWKIAEPSSDLPRDRWWSIFKDAELNRLESLSETNNQDLAANFARLEQARAQVNVARSDIFPHISASPGITRQRSSVNQFEQGHPNGTSYTYNNFSVGLDAAWELDVWGRVRKQVQAARARLNAASDDVEAVKLAVHAEIAIDYFALRSLDSESALLKQTVETYVRSLDLTRNRRTGGVGTDLDVAQAETQLKSAQAQIPAVELQRTKLLHAIATLCGASASTFALEPQSGPVKDPAIIPPLLPSELLERRPDIAAAERRVAAANADIGVAKSAFYPRILFRGFAGFQSIDAGTLFDWPSRVWSLGPSLELPIFTGGRNRAELAISKAAYQETTAVYRQTVLAAFQEIEDQLAAQRLLASQFEFENAALSSARRTLEIANNRYKAGLVTYLEVATAQSSALVHERTVVQLSAERLTAMVGLAKALGGGWTESRTASAPGR